MFMLSVHKPTITADKQYSPFWDVIDRNSTPFNQDTASMKYF